MTIIIYGKPKGKARPRFTKTGHAYTPSGTREYEEQVKLMMQRMFGITIRDGEQNG